MAKEKTQNVGTKENERLFHYEILGIILLILSMLAIAKMGLIGKYLMLTVKVLFGDWYFLIFLLMIFYAIRCIIVHRRLKINNIRYLLNIVIKLFEDYFLQFILFCIIKDTIL